jgi:signal transduction histidine kinase
MSAHIENSRINFERDSLTEMVKVALSQKHVSGLVEVLKVIVNSVNAYACVLWEMEPNIDLRDKEIQKDARLFVLASYHIKEDHPDEDKRRSIPIHYVNLIGSVNGDAILTGTVQNISNVKKNHRVQKVDWIKRDNLTSMLSIPINVANSNVSINNKYRIATLALYRNQDIKPFSDNESKLLKQMSELLLPLYQAIQDRVEKELLEEISEIIDEAEKREKIQDDIYKEKREIEKSLEHISEKKEKPEIKKSLEHICEKVRENFQCVEVSVFLKAENKEDIEFELYATTCEAWSKDRKNSYKPDEKEGLTGWVLKNKETLQIFDLGNFKEEKLKLEKRNSKYKDLIWNDSFDIKKLARIKLNIPNNQHMPPLNFVAVPILRENEVLGVIRCSVASKAPWFFIERQKLLEQVSSQISRFWDKWLQHFVERKENSEWRQLFHKINVLNKEVLDSLIKSPVKKVDLYRNVIRITEEIIQAADIVDIMLFDDRKQEIYFADVGTKWTETVSNAEVKAKKNKRFSMYNHPENSLIKEASRIYDHTQVRIINNLEKTGMKSSVFPETKRIIIAPIRHQEKPDGLLGIRITKENGNFTSYNPLMAELLGQQLGLYLSLLKHDSEQTQTFENLFHQLKSPVGQILARTYKLLYRGAGEINSEEIEKLGKIEKELLTLRGLARKAKRVTNNSGIFTELAAQNKLNISNLSLQRLYNSGSENYNLVKMLIEMSIDTQTLERDKNVYFNVNQSSFNVLQENRVMVNTDMLEQAITCLLDNAGKYSFSDTNVIISGSVKTTDKFYFVISVKSEGIVIKSHEIENCKERKYRGEEAKGVVGEGAGIGLWITDNIMRAHGGRLEILSNPLTYLTEVRLFFPILQRENLNNETTNR